MVAGGSESRIHLGCFDGVFPALLSVPLGRKRPAQVGVRRSEV